MEGAKRIEDKTTDKKFDTKKTKQKKKPTKVKPVGKEYFDKKILEGKSAETKYKEKLRGTRKSDTIARVRDTTIARIDNRLSEESEDDVSAEATGKSLEIGNAIYSRLSKDSKYVRAKNNQTAQKIFDKVRNCKSEKGGDATGKYSKKASESAVKRADTIKRADAIKRQNVNRAIQEKRLSKVRYAKEKEKKITQTFETVKESTVKAARKTVEILKKNSTMTMLVSSCLVLFITISAGLGSCAVALSSGSGTYLSGMSGAFDPNMTDCDSYLSQKEIELEKKLDRIEMDYPNYDEYLYECDEIGHDSLALMAYLSAVYDAYDLTKVSDVLDQFYAEMYSLELIPETEIRTKYEYDPKTKKYVEVEYEYKILNIFLKAKTWDEVLEGKFPDESSKERYEIYMDTDGAHQAFYNPFDTDWSARITDDFGWRLNPFDRSEEFHSGIDIGMPEGTDIKAVGSGKVITATYTASTGNYIVIEDEMGFTHHYMHLSGFNVSAGDTVKHGDIVGQVGSTGPSTGPHLHLGIKDDTGHWLNPEFLVSTFEGGD